MVKICNVDGCDFKVRARNMCAKHYDSWNRKSKTDICQVDECFTIVRTNNYCSMHYTRWLNNGDPLIVRKPARPKGPNHYEWKSRPGYVAIHKRIRSSRGLATGYDCIDCGNQALDWSLNMNCNYEYVMHKGLPKVVSYDIMDYDPRCRQCHSIYDRKYMKQGEQ